MSLKKYRTLKAFPFDNSYAEKGAEVGLTDKQATFLLEGGFVELVEEVAAPAAEQLPAAETAKKGSK